MSASRQSVRFVDGGDIATLLDASINADVVRYLESQNPSCHSDVGEALIGSAEKCGDWFAFSPSFQNYKYVALITRRKIFALGVGQRTICYRMPQSLRATAISTGAAEANEIGASWVKFELFRNDWPSPDLPFWTLRTYAAAREV